MTEEKKDKLIVCKDCGKEFVFPVRDQEFYAEKGFSEPARCKECRDKRKAEKNNSNFNGRRSNFNNDVDKAA